MCNRCRGFMIDVWDYDAGWEGKCVNCGNVQQILTGGQRYGNTGQPMYTPEPVTAAGVGARAA